MKNPLSKKFNFLTLILFALPNMIMMVFLSLYTIADGMFISRFVNTLALSAINMSFPINCVEMSIAIMLATGGSAIIARLLGEGNDKKAKECFTFIIGVSLLIGVLFAVFGNIFLDRLLTLLGTSNLQFDYCKSYTRILLIFAPAFFMQTAFQVLFVTAGKPVLGLLTTVLGGIANIVLDYLFIAVFDMGINGAAYATVIGYIIPGLTGLIYFTFNRKGTLYFTPFKPDLRVLIKSCTNGSSEMVSNIANAVTTFLFNIIFMRLLGEDGVAAITIMLYFQFVFSSIYFGYSIGVAPVFSYKFGYGDKEQIKSCFRSSIIFIAISSVLSYIISLKVIRLSLLMFTSANSNVYAIALEGFPIYAVSFIIMGISVFASAMFTAFSDGKTSAIISFNRTFILLVAALIILPFVFGKTGAWIATPAAEALGSIVSLYYLIKNKKIYNY